MEVLILVSVLLVAVFTLSGMMIFEYYAKICQKRKVKTLESLKRGDKIQINYPGCDSKAVFLSLVADDMYVITFTNNIQNNAVILPYSSFAKKL